MKRSDAVKAISDNVLSSFLDNAPLNIRNLIADCMLAEAEKFMVPKPRRDFINGAAFISHTWEPETQEQE